MTTIMTTFLPPCTSSHLHEYHHISFQAVQDFGWNSSSLYLLYVVTFWTDLSARTLGTWNLDLVLFRDLLFSAFFSSSWWVFLWYARFLALSFVLQTSHDIILSAQGLTLLWIFLMCILRTFAFFNTESQSANGQFLGFSVCFKKWLFICLSDDSILSHPGHLHLEEMASWTAFVWTWTQQFIIKLILVLRLL